MGRESRGEDGIEAHRDVVEAWVQFLAKDHENLPLEQCQQACKEVGSMVCGLSTPRVLLCGLPGSLGRVLGIEANKKGIET